VAGPKHRLASCRPCFATPSFASRPSGPCPSDKPLAKLSTPVERSSSVVGRLVRPSVPAALSPSRTRRDPGLREPGLRPCLMPKPRIGSSQRRPRSLIKGVVMKTRRLWFTVLVLTSLLCASGTLAGAQSLPTKATTVFKLTKVTVSPDPITANTQKGTFTAYWTGHPVFPVTIFGSSRSCPPGIECDPISHKFSKSSDPLVLKNFWTCIGTVPAGFTFKYWIWAVDAKGRTTGLYKLNEPCHD